MSEQLDKLRTLLKEDIATIVEEALDKRLGAISSLDPTHIKGLIMADIINYITMNTKVEPKFSSDPNVDVIDVMIAGKQCFTIKVMNNTGVSSKLAVLEHRLTKKIDRLI